MRSIIPFNDSWLYSPEELPIDAVDSAFHPIRLPHTNLELPYHNFHDQEYQFVSSYRKRFVLPEPLNGRRLYIDFEGVMTAATVTINGHTFAEHKGGFVPFSFDVTDFVHEDGENDLFVSVDSRERGDIPPHGGQVDYLVFGGIYREVSLRYVHPIHIKNVHIKTHDVLSGAPRIEIDVHVKNQTDSVQGVCVVAGMEFWKDEIKRDAVPARGEAVITLWSSLQDFPQGSFQLWSLSNPKLYNFKVSLLEAETAISASEIEYDAVTVRSGFRTAEFKEDGFYLNGEKLFLRGLNRHQMYPYIGMAAPKRLQERDAEILKEYGCNIVRTSHYPQSKHFLNRCDELGLLVFEEIPGWQHIGNLDWQDISVRDVRAMIERDWNHPSIIIWSIRINESWDNEAFYKRTNALARQLDPTRPTTGVRFFPDSQFLEDVYGYNDFSNGIIEPNHSPWLVTEFNGHMFSTKTFDGEERQMEHMVRHARVQSQAISMGGVSGAIGWCAFDYNTHVDFGSGDRICYHGVMDMFRQPKWASYVYRSQKSPQEEIYLQVASFWTMGDRSGGGNDPLYILTNCDSIDIYVGDEFHGRFLPSHDEFPNLPHPPVKVKGLGLHWGSKFAELKVVGNLQDKPVTEQRIAADSIPAKLVAYCEDSILDADGSDMTRLVFKITDVYGNRLPYAIQTIHAEVLEGDVRIVGDNPFPLVGGQGALFVRAGTQAGHVRIKVSTFRLESVEIELSLQ